MDYNYNFFAQRVRAIFSGLYARLFIYYNDLIQTHVFDPTDERELTAFLKSQFDLIEQRNMSMSDKDVKIGYVETVRIVNKEFVYDLNHLVCSGDEMLSARPNIREALSQHLYLEQYGDWKMRILNTAHRVFLKHLHQAQIKYNNRPKLSMQNDLFKPMGQDLFIYMNENFHYPFITVKYTILYHFLGPSEKDFLKGTAQAYMNYVRENCPIDKKFSRLSFDSIFDSRYEKHQQELSLLYQNFLEAQNN